MMIYIHVAYCKTKCIYCDFYSGGNPQWERYIKAVENELAERLPELHSDSLSSLYIGGGTPSLMPADMLERLMGDIRETLRKGGKRLEDDAEITMEVNPEDVSERNAEIWKRSGVNRVSMGIQSLNDDELKLLRRRHSAEKTVEALKILKHYFKNVSVDIIYGIPGQTEETLRETLGRILKEEPEHISAYALTYEPGTALEVLREKGMIGEATEEEYEALENLLLGELRSAGYERYEISNFAREGYRSRHNSGYWDGREYLGIGPAACSYDGENRRRSNNRDLKGYIAYWLGESGDGEEKIYEEETLTREERIIEREFTSLRRKEGIDLEAYGRDFGREELERLLRKAERWIGSGDMTLEGGWLALTEKGMRRGDYIINN